MDMPNKLIVGIDNEIVELTGEAAEAFLADRQKIIDGIEEGKKARLIREESRNSALQKLKTLANLTDDEISALISI